MALTTGGTIALCILNWLYAQVAPLLEALKAILLAIIQFIDSQVLWLKAQLSMLDILKAMEEAAWAIVQALIDKIRDTLTAIPGTGPLRALCPEFYAMITNPALEIFDLSVAGLSIYRERYKNVLSFMDEVEALYQYWNTIKLELVALVESVDDAIYWAKMEAASAVP
jgi:hypothetical protein